MAIEKYSLLINEINKAITEFEGYLTDVIKFPRLDDNYLSDSSNCLNLKESNWAEVDFPKSESKGVYFLLGTKPDNENNIAVYVGKASFNSKIGNRVEAHLKYGDKYNKVYDFNGYAIEYVVSIALDDPEDRAFLSPALEEFIIGELKETKITLLNKIGNYD